MDINTVIYILIAAVCAALVSFSCTPPVRALAYLIGAIDVPRDKRHIHKLPTPLIGGYAIYLGFTLSTFVFCELDGTLVALWTGGSILVIVGILDDIYVLTPHLKILMQLSAALMAVSCGVSINEITLFGRAFVLGALEIPVTLIWIVGLTNAFNLIDGLDGLACGTSAICSASISVVMVLSGDIAPALLTMILTGACVGFIPFNKNPAKIFMGDTGSLFLGYSLSVISIGGLFKMHTVISFIVPLTVFALPLADTASSVVRRIACGQSPFAPDRRHLHHKLVDMGFTQKESVKILYSASALMGLVSVMFSDAMLNFTPPIKALTLLFGVIIILYIDYVIIKNPVLRLRSGLFRDENKLSCKRLKRKVEIATIFSEINSNDCKESNRKDELL